MPLLVLPVFAALITGAPVSVEWAEGSACRADGIPAKVDEQVLSGGAAEAGREEVPVDARLSVVEGTQGVHAIVELTTPHGESVRELDAQSCDSLHDAVALLLAMHVDPLRSGIEPNDEEEMPPDEPVPAAVPGEPAEETDVVSTEPESASTVAEEDDSIVAVDAESQPEPGPTRVVSGLVRAGFGVLAGPLPSGALAIFGAGGVHWHRLRFELRGTYALPRSAALDAGAGTSAAFSLWSLGPSVCFEPRWDQISLAFCGAIEAGRMRVRPRGVIDGVSRVRPYVTAVGGTRLQGWFLPWLNGWVGVEAGGVLVRPRFGVRGGADVHIARPWVVLGGFGLEAHFG